MSARPIDRQACRCNQCRQRDEREWEDLVERLEATPALTSRAAVEIAHWRETEELVRRVNEYGWGKRTA